MVSVIDALTPRALIEQAARRLRAAGLSNARREAEWLAVHAARVNGTPVAHPPLAGTRARSLAHIPRGSFFDEEPIPSTVTASFNELVRRRAAWEPLQYLLGSAFFYGLEFEVTPATLIPRPETELLVAAALERLPERFVAVDAGTGSGCVAISLTHARPLCRMLALDRSFEALAVARRNARRHGVAARIAWMQSDWCDALRGLAHVDAIVANPPYIPTRELSGLPLDVQCEPPSALDGGPDGLAGHRRLLQDGGRCLRAGGWLLMELGIGQAPAVARIAQTAGEWDASQLIRDPQGIERVFIVQRKQLTGTGSVCSSEPVPCLPMSCGRWGTGTEPRENRFRTRRG